MGNLYRLVGSATGLTSPSGTPSTRPWRNAALWLALLGPFFFASYGLANWLASQRDNVGSVIFAWEHAIPFWPWTIVPYWSIDLLYVLSLLICRSQQELIVQVKRLLTVQVIAVACFIIWPLRFATARPEAEGFFKTLFNLLASFDQPFNQAPSLHIALLVVLWVRFSAHTSGFGRLLLHAWSVLIGISVLTTYQHHFVDVPTGWALGWFAVWLFPETTPSPLSNWQLTRDQSRRRIATRYLLGAVLIGTWALSVGGAWLWLLWLAGALGLVAIVYFGLDASSFQKNANGQMSMASYWLFGPYFLAAWINSRLWTRREPPSHPIASGVWLGRIPSRSECAKFNAIVDLCAELPTQKLTQSYSSIPVLDLTTPSQAQLAAAATAIENSIANGNTLVCCALGYSRSALACAAWLLHSGRSQTAAEALDQIRAVRPRIVIGAEQLALLEKFVQSGSTP
jgi:protein-tyrosine phosphatase/membrane-associated phospholipid phosphatase